MKKALLKDSLKEIVKTYKRFISILLMAFLGVGFFAGVRATSPDMKLTIDEYYDKQNLYDINVISTLGLTDDDVEAISQVNGIEKAIGIYTKDVYVSFGGEETVVKTYELNEEINNIEVIEGNLPQNAEECVIEENMKRSENISIGDYIEIRENLSEDEEPSFKNARLKVVGIVKSPLYISRDRGTTTLGSGKITYYMYLNKENIVSDIYTEIDIIAKDAKILSTLDIEYTNLIASLKDNLEDIKGIRQTARYNELKNEANEKLQEAQNEFDTQKADAEQKIAEAEKKIADGKEEIREAEETLRNSQKELADARNTAQTEFANAENQINDAQNKLKIYQETLDNNKKIFGESKKETEKQIAELQGIIDNYNVYTASLQQEELAIRENLRQIKEKIKENEENIAILEGHKKETDGDTTEIELQIQKLKDENQLKEKEKIDEEEKLDKKLSEIAEVTAEKAKYAGILEAINSKLIAAEKELKQMQNQLDTAWKELNQSKVKLEQTKLETEQKFNDAEREIADGKRKIADSKIELRDGEIELEEKKTEFNVEIADAEAKLIDAREKINDIEEAKWYILDRNDNSGFNSYSQDTDNVKKLGEAFPIVFFIIATLISLTSMSRMVEEQRVQIGTLKALRI